MINPHAVRLRGTAAAYIPATTKAERAANQSSDQDEDVGGVGGTLAANALSMAAMRATLSKVLTQEFYGRNIPLAERFNEGVQSVIKEYDLPWNTTSLGCRTEYWFRKEPAQNGAEAEAAFDDLLDKYMHLATMNSGILLTPFHNMALITEDTTEEDVDCHTKVFHQIVINIVD